MILTVLEAVSQASMEIGIAQRPLNSAIGSLDQDAVQMTALLSAVADEVLDEQPYNETLGDGYWLVDKDGATKKNRPTADTDRILFDGRLAINGVKYRFLAAKGLEFGEHLRDFTARLNHLGNAANGRVLDLDVEASVQQ